MNLLTIVHIAARCAVLLFSLVAVGISVTAFTVWKHDQNERCYSNDSDCTDDYDRVVSAFKFAAFAATFAILDTIMSFAFPFFKFIHWAACVVCDALAALFLIAGGLAVVVVMKKYGMNSWCSWPKQFAMWRHRCEGGKSDIVFLFLAAVALGIAGLVGFMKRRKDGKVAGGQRPVELHTAI